MFEYAISCGEGTLLEYGVSDYQSIIDAVLLAGLEHEGYELLICRPASQDCQTGQ